MMSWLSYAMFLAVEPANKILKYDHSIESSRVRFRCSDVGFSQDEINVLKLQKIVDVVWHCEEKKG